MDDNTIEIRDDEINVEEIMAKIRENIRRRQAAGELPPDPDSIIASTLKKCPAGGSDGAIERDLSYINANWDIRNNSYFISSHHPHIGRFLVKGRQLVHGEVRRYVDPMISRQTEFNASTVRILTRASQQCAELDLKVLHQDEKLTQRISQEKEELTQRISQEKEELTQRISQEKEELNVNIKKTIDGSVQDIFSHLDKDFRLQVGLTHVLEKRMQKGLVQKSTTPTESIALPNDTNYFLFEERFRGSREEIKQRQLAFLPYFEKCSRVLDIGCGRGEFLEILKEQGIGGIGVDSDPDMITYCRSRQLAVEQSDALAYLETLEDKSLDGIFIDQVIEHLEPDYLIRLLALCYQKLKIGYYLIVETVNPLSFSSFVNFYIDLTHKRPVHPETLQYLFNVSGFREWEKRFVSPVSEEYQLKKIQDIPKCEDYMQKNVGIYNHNIDILNSMLLGAQDYVVIGKK
jgi:SAM-dependent methyltransferase